MTRSAFLGEFEQITLLAVARLREDAYGVAIRLEIEERDDPLVGFRVRFEMPDDVGAEDAIPGKARVLRHIHQAGEAAVRECRQDVLRLQAGKTGNRVGPRT